MRLSREACKNCLFMACTSRATLHIVPKSNKNVKKTQHGRSVIRCAIRNRSSTFYFFENSTNLSRLWRKNLPACAIDSQFFLDSWRDFMILYIVRKFQSNGRTNVANTFYDSYHAIPRPFGNAKIDFPKNYVARASTSLTTHTETYPASRIRTWG